MSTDPELRLRSALRDLDRDTGAPPDPVTWVKARVARDRRRRAALLPVVAAVAVLLVALAVPLSRRSPADTATAAGGDPLSLVGRWYVDDAGAPAGTALVLGSGSALVFLPCGVLDGEYRADAEQSLFVATADAGDTSCFPGAGSYPLPWLTSARSYRSDGALRLLLDADGRTLAVLRPGAHPTVGPNRLASAFEGEPEVTDAWRAQARTPAPLPDGVRPPTAEELVADWQPVGLPAGNKAHLAFLDDGRWYGSDGCNGSRSRYVLGERGRLLATVGGSTLIGCTGAPVAGQLGSAARIGLVDGQLVLYDRSGEEVVRMARVGGAVPPSPFR